MLTDSSLGLTLTARSETQIATFTVQRPSTTASTASTGLSQIIPTLLTAIDEEEDHVQDAFQATVCLGWLHYVIEEPGLAVGRLPKDFGTVARKMSDKDGTLSGWTRVCICKGAFLKGTAARTDIICVHLEFRVLTMFRFVSGKNGCGGGSCSHIRLSPPLAFFSALSRH